MLSLLKAIIPILLFFAVSQGQELRSNKLSDSLNSNIELKFPEWRFNDPLFLISPEISILKLELANQSLSNPLPPFSWTLVRNFELETIWRQELAEQNKMRTLKVILGSVQIGGVAYLTYLHIKKYGLK